MTATTLLPAAYLLLFCATIGVFIWWGRRQRKRRAPFKRETKLLRQPGESLRHKIEELDEKLPIELAAASLVPVTAGFLCLQSVRFLSGWSLLAGVVVAALAFAFVFASTTKWAARKFFIRGNHELGWYGERVVGDALAPLERKGWRIFHDFPRAVKRQPFNIDHIAVGPTGVYALETKSPRKGEALPNREDHVVTFDGARLHWPWGENQMGVEQAIDNAKWLGNWIRERTGKDYRVGAVLVFPDWLVRDVKTGPLTVAGSALLAARLTEFPIVLEAHEIDQVARLIEGVCRDIEY